MSITADTSDTSRFIQDLDEFDRRLFEHRLEWLSLARPDQLPPDQSDRKWDTWLLLAGRGSGKTRAGAENSLWTGGSNPGWRIALIAPTFSDIRDTQVEGDSGILALLDKAGLEHKYNRSLGEIRLANGTLYKGLAAQTPERLRGPQHHAGWLDELCSFEYGEDTWDMFLFGLRLGTEPKAVITTTPKTQPLLVQIMNEPSTHVSTASTFDNSENLSDRALATFRRKYEGTRLGKQELYAGLLSDTPGALWTDSSFQRLTADPFETAKLCDKVLVVVDPSGATTEGKLTSETGSLSDEIGIIVAGSRRSPDDPEDLQYFILGDHSVGDGPDVWARTSVQMYHAYGADAIAAETNFGGGMVEALIRNYDPDVPYKGIKASRGKAVRAQPVAVLYEQKKVWHVGPDHRYAKLEEQLTQFTASHYTGPGSPDRADAMIHALSELAEGKLVPISAFGAPGRTNGFRNPMSAVVNDTIHDAEILYDAPAHPLQIEQQGAIPIALPG